jgi:hypothetical protein
MGGVCAIAGTIIAGISNSMHPALADPAGVVRNAADTSKWAAIHWGLIIGIVVMQLGFYSVIESLRPSVENNTNRGKYVLLAAYTLTAGLVLWICVFTAEIGLKPLADAVKTDTSSQIGALALASMADATATAATCVYFLGITLLGLALFLSDRYPRWMGITGLVLGAVLTLSVGLRKAFLGPSPWTEGIPFQTLVVLFWIWTVILAVHLWRNSSRMGDFAHDFSPTLP